MAKPNFKKPSGTKVPKVVEKIDENSAPVVSIAATSSANAFNNEPLKDRIGRFNRIALGTAWKSRASIEQLGRELLGGEVRIFSGLSQNEVAFEIEGIRVPAAGYYFIR